MNVYSKIVQAHLQLGQADLALEYAERSRSQGLVDLMASNQFYGDREMTPEASQYLEQYEILQRRIDAIRFGYSLQPALARGEQDRKYRSPDLLQAELEEVAALEAQKQEIWQYLRSLDPMVAAGQQVEPLKIQQMQQLIQSPTTALLSFYSTENDTYIFILRQNQTPQVHVCEGQGRETLQNWLIYNWFIPYGDDQPKWIENMGQLLQELSKRLQLNELIDQHLTNIKELILVPHLFLHQIPFAALPLTNTSSIPSVPVTEFEEKLNTRGLKIDIKPKSKPKPNQNQPNTYLGDKFILRQIPSCQILNLISERKPTNKSNQRIGIVEDATEDLVFTSYECETIATQYNIPASERLQGKQAKVRDYRQLAKKLQILHSSHHASSNLNNPLDSALMLADGRITLGELLAGSWRLPDLEEVFLSCCETNLTLSKITDDIFTIATGFLCAGARSAISTQWAVQDFATALLTILYYENRAKGVTVAVSLQQAQQKLRGLSGDCLRREYKEELEQYLKQKLDRVKEKEKVAKEKDDQEELAKLLKMEEILAKQKQITLPKYCEEAFPFASPYFWAGFIAQGL